MTHIAFDKLLGMEFATLQDALRVFRGISPRVSPTYEELDLLMSRVRPGVRIIDKADIDNLCIAPNRFIPDTKLVATGVKLQIPIEGTDTILLADYLSDGSISISEEAVREAYKHLSR